MRLRHLEVFHAVMRAGSVSGAARLLNVSQPAVTKVLQHAEAQLGLLLFERVKGKFHPTPEAQRLFTEVDKLHGELLSIRRLAASLRAGPAWGVRISVTPALGATVAPQAIARWTRAVPEGHCELSTHHTRELVQALLLSELDLGLSLHDPQHPGVHAEVLVRAPMMALLPGRRGAGPALSAGVMPESLPLSALPKELVGLSGTDPLGLRVMAECEAQGLSLQPRVTVQTYQIARQLAEAGVGAAIVDPFTAASADRQRVSVRLIEPVIPVPLVLLTPMSRPLSQPARRLVRHLGDAARGCLEAAGIPVLPGPGAGASAEPAGEPAAGAAADASSRPSAAAAAAAAAAVGFGARGA